MIKALIFDCFGVFYPDPVFTYMRDPQTPPEIGEALHTLNEQAARGKITKNQFIENAAIAYTTTSNRATIFSAP